MGFVLRSEYLPCYTYEDYKKWKDNWELIEGIPYAMAPSPMKSHQFLVGLLFNSIYQQLKEKGCLSSCKPLFEIDWIISQTTVLRPDLLIVCDDEAEDFVRKTPRVTFEIVSPSSVFKDENIKFAIYQQEGVDFYVLIYPKERRVKVYKLTNGHYVKVFDDVKGMLEMEFRSGCSLELDLEKLWEEVI